MIVYWYNSLTYIYCKCWRTIASMYASNATKYFYFPGWRTLSLYCLQLPSWLSHAVPDISIELSRWWGLTEPDTGKGHMEREREEEPKTCCTGCFLSLLGPSLLAAPIMALSPKHIFHFNVCNSFNWRICKLQLWLNSLLLRSLMQIILQFESTVFPHNSLHELWGSEWREWKPFWLFVSIRELQDAEESTWERMRAEQLVSVCGKSQVCAAVCTVNGGNSLW